MSVATLSAISGSRLYLWVPERFWSLNRRLVWEPALGGGGRYESWVGAGERVFLCRSQRAGEGAQQGSGMEELMAGWL